eukprot:1579134-Heterocapsa_arctica.AAC.1
MLEGFDLSNSVHSVAHPPLPRRFREGLSNVDELEVFEELHRDVLGQVRVRKSGVGGRQWIAQMLVEDCDVSRRGKLVLCYLACARDPVEYCFAYPDEHGVFVKHVSSDVVELL